MSIQRWVIRLLALVFLLGANMAFSNSLVLMSELDGQLVGNSGAPAASVRLVRTWEWAWSRQQGSDEATTDTQGRFHFPAVTGRSLSARFFPHEPHIHQRITAYHSDGRTEIWSAIKANYRLNGELGGRPLRLLCGLADVPGDEQDRLFNSQCVLEDSTP